MYTWTIYCSNLNFKVFRFKSMGLVWGTTQSTFTIMMCFVGAILYTHKTVNNVESQFKPWRT